jgi:hypothetical protein
VALTPADLAAARTTPTAFWVSTPGYTVLVVVDQGGMIRHCAPYLRRVRQDKPWSNLCAGLRRRHGAGLRVERLG